MAQIVEKRPEDALPAQPAEPDPALTARAEALAGRLESLADTLERESANT